MKLSENHKRRITATADVLERRLGELELSFFRSRILSKGIRTVYKNDVPDSLQEEIHFRLNRLYDLLKQFCRHYHMAPKEMSLKKLLLINAVFLWEELSTLARAGLKSHGHDPEELHVDYEKHLNGMIDEVNILIAELNDQGS